VTADVLTAAVAAHRAGQAGAFESSLDLLVTAPRVELSAALVARLTAALAAAWARGWQPADVVRAVGRTDGVGHTGLAADLIAAQAARYEASEVDERWAAQVPVPRITLADPGAFLDRWGATAGVDPVLAVRYAVEVLATVEALPVIPLLMAPPGRATTQARTPTAGRTRAKGRPDAASRMLDRVRALLAKAESSEFPSEAEAFTAKAQELTARHSLDHALLTGGSGGEQPEAVRVGVDSPYEEAKALLLQNVAEANLARSVWSAELGFATIFGFPDDLRAVELIYASLLVQGTAAMVREGSGKRARSFRQSFLYAYATRIGQRLRTATEGARQGTAEDLLPVLASREMAVRDKVAEVFGEFTTRRTRIRDERGWRSGTAAADNVPLP
jgi:hypothetical protein